MIVMGLRVMKMLKGRYDHLTARECDVVALLAQGFSAKEAASALSISPGTVEKHVEVMMMKLRARNRVQMTLIAVTEGLIDLSDRGDRRQTTMDEAPAETAHMPRQTDST